MLSGVARETTICHWVTVHFSITKIVMSHLMQNKSICAFACYSKPPNYLQSDFLGINRLQGWVPESVTFNV
jgi:hypothetical protein